MKINEKKIVSIIGSTGSVGSSAIEIIKLHPDKFEVEFLVAQQNYLKLIQQALDIKPKKIYIENETHIDKLKSDLKDTGIMIYSGRESILNAIKDSQSEYLLIASSGTKTIEYFSLAIEYIKNIAIANKESIVCAWNVLRSKIDKFKPFIIPVDSEHSSIFQIIHNNKPKNIKKLVITGSGGPFLDYDIKKLKDVTLEQAINHPNWSMGKKISIDSATFMNKALEFIEASYLFNLNQNDIEVLIHRQSIMHGGVSFVDGTFIGNFSYPSMEIPIAYSLSFPDRILTNSQDIYLSKIKNLQFEELDEERFISIKLAKKVLDYGGNYPTIFNISNEIAVDYFINKKISFINILDVVKYSLDTIEYQAFSSIDEILYCYEVISKQISQNIHKF